MSNESISKASDRNSDRRGFISKYVIPGGNTVLNSIALSKINKVDRKLDDIMQQKVDGEVASIIIGLSDLYIDTSPQVPEGLPPAQPYFQKKRGINETIAQQIVSQILKKTDGSRLYFELIVQLLDGGGREQRAVFEHTIYMGAADLDSLTFEDCVQRAKQADISNQSDVACQKLVGHIYSALCIYLRTLEFPRAMSVNLRYYGELAEGGGTVFTLEDVAAGKLTFTGERDISPQLQLPGAPTEGPM